MSNDAAAETTTQTFLVVLGKKDALVRELERLAKRARRLGSMPITWAFGGLTYKDVRMLRSGVTADQVEILGPEFCYVTRKVPFIEMVLTGEAPRLNGWTFAATIQQLEGVNILRRVPSVDLEIPEVFRTRGPACDHCKANRRRNDTYLLVNAESRWMQVGSGCLVDFLGHKDPLVIARYAELLASAASLCASAETGSEGGGMGRGQPVYALVDYLTCVAAEIREGGWVPKSRAPIPSASTAAMAEERLDPPRGAKTRDRSVTAADIAIAEASAEWALALEGSGERMNDYLWNLHAVARAGIADGRTFGIAASMVAAYTKAEARKRELASRAPSAYVGEVGERRSFALTLQHHHGFDSPFGWKSLYKFVDEDGNVFAWFTMSGGPESSGDTELAVGTEYTVFGTIKEHEEYKGVRQNVLARCFITPHDPNAYEATRNEENRKALAKKAKAGPLSEDEQRTLETLQKAAREASRAARKTKKAKKTSAADEAPAASG